METLLFIGTQEIILLFMVSVLGFVPFIFAVIALIDLFKRDFDDKTTDKILLILLILLAPLIGSIIYYFMLRKNYPLKREKNISM